MAQLIGRFIGDDSGATAIEYGLIGVLISVAIIAAVTALGGGVGNLFAEISNKVANSMNHHQIANTPSS